MAGYGPEPSRDDMSPQAVAHRVAQASEDVRSNARREAAGWTPETAGYLFGKVAFVVICLVAIAYALIR